MRTIARLVVLLGSLTLASSGGINWKTVWLEPNPIYLQFPGPPISYVVKGINGADYKADLTKSQDLRVVSSDNSVIEVDQKSAQLIPKGIGQTEIRVAFSECVSLNQVVVAAPTESR